MTNASGAARNEPAWVTLGSADPQAAATFYQAVLGWELSDDGEQALGSVAGRPVAAIGHAAGDAPPTARGWLLHIEVNNVATAVDTVTRAGGSTLVPATADTDATVAVVSDSNGTRFGLHDSGAELHGRSPSPGALPGVS